MWDFRYLRTHRPPCPVTGLALFLLFFSLTALDSIKIEIQSFDYLTGMGYSCFLYFASVRCLRWSDLLFKVSDSVNKHQENVRRGLTWPLSEYTLQKADVIVTCSLSYDTVVLETAPEVSSIENSGFNIGRFLQLFPPSPSRQLYIAYWSPWKRLQLVGMIIGAIWTSRLVERTHYLIQRLVC
jgi:hypothetical protein